jgi:hypothetical protein
LPFSPLTPTLSPQGFRGGQGIKNLNSTLKS